MVWTVVALTAALAVGLVLALRRARPPASCATCGRALPPGQATCRSCVIGRSRVNDIQVIDVSVSSQHCRVRLEDGRFVVHDLKSTNGTIVNEKKVSRHVLEEGDVIAIGETAFQYRRDLKRS
jgi:predicted component of type VI protein secretion system